MKKTILLSLAIVVSITGLFAQKVKTIDGTPEVIKGDKNINIIFTYDNLKVGKMEEAAYIEREVNERDEKEAGKGEIWAGKWQKDKEDRYPELFIKLFNRYGSDLFGSNVVPDATDAKYTMKVNISWIEPGFNVGVMRKPAGVSMEIYIYETANPTEILHKLTIINSPGTSTGNDYDAGERIKEAFAKAAKQYAKYIYKKHLK